MGILLTIWSLLTSRIGQLVIVGIVAFGIGYGQADRKAEVERLNAEVVTAKSDKATAESAEALAKRQASDLDRRHEINEQHIEKLQSDLEQAQHQKPGVKVVTKTIKVPVPVSRDCGLTEDQIRQFKEIR